jgi:hypothetical protein
MTRIACPQANREIDGDPCLRIQIGSLRCALEASIQPSVPHKPFAHDSHNIPNLLPVARSHQIESP